MTAFTPTSITIDPPADSPVDRLGRGVVRSLLRSPQMAGSLGLARTVAYGVISFGLLPLLSFPRRVAAHARLENDQAWYTRQWLARLGQPEADGESELPYPPPLDPRVLALCYAARGVAMAMAVALLVLVSSVHASWRDVFGATWGAWGAWGVGREIGLAPHHRFYSFWCAGMLLGYSIDVAAVLVHERVRRGRLNELNAAFADRAWFRPIRMPFQDEPVLLPIVIGAILGIVLAACGALWALPMMLASGVHSRYTSVGGRHVRRALRYRVRLALAADPTLAARLRAPRPIWYGCTACRQHVPPQALKCPQCGTPVSAESSVATVGT